MAPAVVAALLTRDVVPYLASNLTLAGCGFSCRVRVCLLSKFES